VVGISADAPDRNLAWSRELRLPFRLLSDLTPAGAVGRKYGVWHDLWRIERRATFIVDRTGTVRWTESGGVCIDTGRTLDALSRLARQR
jgi:peroxiredoxin